MANEFGESLMSRSLRAVMLRDLFRKFALKDWQNFVAAVSGHDALGELERAQAAQEVNAPR